MKMTGSIGVIHVSQCDNGCFIAKFSMRGESFMVSTNEMSSEIEAKVRCMFEVLKYIEESGRHEIVDLFYPIWKSMVFEIEKFDEKMQIILECGLYLKTAIEVGFYELRNNILRMVHLIEEQEGLNNLCKEGYSAIEEITGVKEKILYLSGNLQNSKVKHDNFL